LWRAIGFLVLVILVALGIRPLRPRKIWLAPIVEHPAEDAHGDGRNRGGAQALGPAERVERGAAEQLTDSRNADQDPHAGE
jgi:hypothetical protein